MGQGNLSRAGRTWSSSLVNTVVKREVVRSFTERVDSYIYPLVCLSHERTVCDVTEGGELIAFAIADVVHPRISRVRVHELHVCQRHRRRGHATSLVLLLDGLLPRGRPRRRWAWARR
jgi:hypothetical protein